ncbi:MAG: TatD family hydrolase [Bacteroidales bacterium]|nr:TatD family hydrolase [Bacteroidales bacterium]
MSWIDTHAHLYLKEFNHDFYHVVERAKLNDVEKVILPDLDSTEREKMINVFRTDPHFFSFMLGIHPTSVKSNYREEILKLEESFNNYPNPCGIGEIGIDLYWDITYKKEQIEVFEYQLHLAQKFNLPVSIHQRNSIELVLDILQHFNGKITGILHCFSGNVEQAKKAVNIGFYLGIGGVVTYKNSQIAEVVKNVGLSALVLETDAPYLSPAPLRGKRNEPAFLPIIAEKISSLTGHSIEEVARITYQNSKKLFYYE